MADLDSSSFLSPSGTDSDVPLPLRLKHLPRANRVMAYPPPGGSASSAPSNVQQVPEKEMPCLAVRDVNDSRADTAALAKEWLAWIKDDLYPWSQKNPQTKQIAEAASHVDKGVFNDKPVFNKDDESHPQKFVVRLIEADTFTAARQLRRRYPQDRIAVLNYANERRPGGGFEGGSMAQEEDLCHASTLLPVLKQAFYPIKATELIYAEDVWVLKQKCPTMIGGAPMPQPEWFSVDVISSAALYRPSLGPPTASIDTKGYVCRWQPYQDPRARLDMKNRLRRILNAALVKKVRRLVLGAFGCGIYGNPTPEVARMLKELLVDDGDHEGDGRGPEVDYAAFGLLEVVIAIFDPQPGQPTWNSFRHVFRSVDKSDIPVSSVMQYTIFPAEYALADHETTEVADSDAEA